MERARNKKALLMSFLLASLVFESLISPIMGRSLEGLSEEKTYYSPNPHPGSTPHNPSYGDPRTPSHGSGVTHGIPTTPSISTPSPLIPDPSIHYFTGTCGYWRTHPEAIWGIFGYLGNVGEFFGPVCGAIFGRNLSLPDALANTRADGIGALFREGTASLLNSIVSRKFPFTTQQVKDAFAAALNSNRAAAAQAELFKQANEGRLKL
ncbi:protodermal factor 1-like [Typha angustifolia]|uniref:protodermal factor 1-like n=1 Tax=Typha angustifolia TaxID=59011 RepID=UPI003C2BD893